MAYYQSNDEIQARMRAMAMKKLLPAHQLAPDINTPEGALTDNMRASTLASNTANQAGQRAPLSFSHGERAVPEDRIRHALKMMESSGGTNAVPRYEPKYHKKMLESYDNRKWIPTPAERRIIAERGFDAATKIFSTSFGEYQILPETAYRYTSFVGDPEDLAKPEVAEKVLSELLAYFHKDEGGDLKGMIHRYNQDPEYFDKFMAYLDEEN